MGKGYQFWFFVTDCSSTVRVFAVRDVAFHG